MDGESRESGRRILVEAQLLPPVFEKVLHAKELLMFGKAKSAADAARQAGISRSAYYKYKDAVYADPAQNEKTLLTVHIRLYDRTGTLSEVLTAFADAGANVLTVNQNIPVGGVAMVSVSAHIDCLSEPYRKFLEHLRELPAVERLTSAVVSGGGNTVYWKEG